MVAAPRIECASIIPRLAPLLVVLYCLVKRHVYLHPAVLNVMPHVDEVAAVINLVEATLFHDLGLRLTWVKALGH